MYYTCFIPLFLLFIINSSAIPTEWHHLAKHSNIDTTSIPHKWAKLPTNLKPTHYNLHLTVTKDSLEKTNTFNGVAEITISVIENTKNITMHGVDLVVSKENVEVSNKDGVIAVSNATLKSNQLFVIDLEEVLKANDEIIAKITYSGILSPTDMVGFYQSTYKVNGTVEYLATTQFEALDARRAFPCFDEPAYKATFDISLTHPKEYNALSNSAPKETKQQTDDPDQVTTSFERTPIMSTYLVAFIVSQFKCDTPSDVSGVEICGLSTDDIDFARTVAEEARDNMNIWTGKAYKDLGQPKMTLAAIPDFLVGAEENWGLITHREANLYASLAKSSDSDMQTVISDVTHEVAHQWFGDYITLHWWNDVFLNEGFATFFEYHAISDTLSKWETRRQFVIEELHPVLLLDSFNSTRPLSMDDTNDNNAPEVVSSMFDNIAYNKGGSILRMINYLLGEDNFKAAITKYVGHRNDEPKYMSTLEKFYGSIQEIVDTEKTISLPDQNVTSVLEGWFKQPGYPILTVSLNEEQTGAVITQKLFSLNGNTDATKWNIPITYSLSKEDFSNTNTKLWLTANDNSVTANMTKDAWIVLNNQQVGYYRVQYDKTLLDRITKELKANVNTIDEMSRSQLIDDQFNLAHVVNKYDDVLTFVQFIQKDSSFYSWSSAFQGYNWLLQSISDADLKEALKVFVLRTMNTLLTDYPITKDIDRENHVQVFTQVLANTWACNLDDSTCLEYVDTVFETVLKDSTSIDVNLLSIVYCTGLRKSSDSSEAYDTLFNLYNSNDLISSQKITLLNSLGCVKDQDKRTKYLESMLTDDIRIQDVKFVFSSVYSNNDNGVQEVLNFIDTNQVGLKKRFGGISPVLSALSNVAGLITTENQLLSLENVCDALRKSDFLQENNLLAIKKKGVDNFNRAGKLQENLMNIFGFI